MNEKRRPTYPAALNMVKLIYTLATQGRSLTLEDIRRILDISERTVRRYLKAMNEFLSNRQGEPLIRVIRTGGVERWRLNETMPLEATPYQLILFEIFHWVMSIGSEARVLEPEELIKMVREEALKILDGYNGRDR